MLLNSPLDCSWWEMIHAIVVPAVQHYPLITEQVFFKGRWTGIRRRSALVTAADVSAGRVEGQLWNREPVEPQTGSRARLAVGEPVLGVGRNCLRLSAVGSEGQRRFLWSA